MRRLIIIVGCMVASVVRCDLHAVEDIRFQAFLATIKQEALAQQIAPEVIDRTLKAAQWLPKVVELDHKQPEFVTAFSTYLQRRITPRSVNQGKQLLHDYAGIFSVVEENYPVPKEVLVAFWALETHFGSTQGDFPLPAALATLAVDGRRASFFKQELLNWMRVLPHTPHIENTALGSWAGATGQMQFMPTTLLNYGVDADRDGVIDIWTSLPDVFHSAANYLTRVGWQSGVPISVAVHLPSGFDYALAQLALKKSLSEWRSLGVTGIAETLPESLSAALVLPQGYDGPAFLVFANFDCVMQWNRSLNYALSVSLFAEQLRQDVFSLKVPAEPRALTFQQMWLLQEALNAQGFDCGQPDGFPGVKTQAAIRRYQATQGLPQDGYAGAALFARLTEQ